MDRLFDNIISIDKFTKRKLNQAKSDDENDDESSFGKGGNVINHRRHHHRHHPLSSGGSNYHHGELTDSHEYRPQQPNHPLPQKQKKKKKKKTSSRARDDKRGSRRSACSPSSPSECDVNKLFYLAETVSLINDYKTILKKPSRHNFMGKPVVEEMAAKKQIIADYLKIAADYIDLTHVIVNEISETCSNCGVKLDCDIIEDDMSICSNCSCEQSRTWTVNSYDDNTRANPTIKCKYDRRNHFVDCINQFQGKQNTVVPEAVFVKLKNRLQFHNLLIGTEGETPDRERYAKVSKSMVNDLIKELGYVKHYDNINLIYSKLTDRKLDDISHLTEALLSDFDKFIEVYDKHFTSNARKNFINIHYVLYHLLRRHSHTTNTNELIHIKNKERKQFHDYVIKTIFDELDWKHTIF